MGLMSLIFYKGRKEGLYVEREVDVPGYGLQAIMRSLDCIGAVCPRPQLFVIKVLEELKAGDVIEVVSDNPSSVEGFPFLAQALNCDFLVSVREEGFWRIYLRKS